MSMPKPSVLIVDCNRNGLASIRSLGRDGWRVIAVDHHRGKAGIYSRYVDEKHIVPRVGTDGREFIDSILKIAKSQSQEKIYLLPTNDEYVQVFADHIDELLEYFVPLFIYDQEKLITISSKVAFASFIERIDLDQPIKYAKTDVLSDSIEYPVILKPDNRRALTNLGRGLFKVKLCRDKSETLKWIQELEEKNSDYILQQFIPGGDDQLYTIGVSAKDGQLLGCFTGRKIRQYPPKAGQATLAEIVNDEKLNRFAERIVIELSYTGIAQIEVKKHEGKYFAIEMNPRSWSWHGLAQAAGVDLPALLANAFRGEKPSETITNQVERGYWYYFIGDLIYNNILNRNVGLGEIIKRCLRSESHAFFDLKDLVPWIVYMVYEVPVRFMEMFRAGKKNIDID